MKIPSIIFFIISTLIFIFRHDNAKYLDRWQNKAWGYESNEQNVKMTEWVLIIVSAFGIALSIIGFFDIKI